MLFGLQFRLLHSLLQLALADDDESGLPVVDDVPEFLDVGPGHAAPQMPADPADRRTDDGGADDGGREQDADDGAGGGAAPGPVPGGHLILVDVDLPGGVFGDHGGVVGADRAGRVQVLDDVVVGARRRFVRIGADINENRIRLRHVVSPSISLKGQVNASPRLKPGGFWLGPHTARDRKEARSMSYVVGTRKGSAHQAHNRSLVTDRTRRAAGQGRDWRIRDGWRSSPARTGSTEARRARVCGRRRGCR